MGLGIHYCEIVQTGKRGLWTVPDRFAQRGGTALVKMFTVGEDWRDPQEMDDLHEWIDRTETLCDRYGTKLRLLGAVRIDNGWIRTGKPSAPGFDRAWFLKQPVAEWWKWATPWIQAGAIPQPAKPMDTDWVYDNASGAKVWWVKANGNPLRFGFAKALMDLSTPYVNWALGECEAWMDEFDADGLDWGLKSDQHREESRYSNGLPYVVPETAAERGSGHMQPVRIPVAQYEATHNWIAKEWNKRGHSMAVNSSGSQDLDWYEARWRKYFSGLNSVVHDYKQHYVKERPW